MSIVLRYLKWVKLCRIIAYYMVVVVIVVSGLQLEIA